MDQLITNFSVKAATDFFFKKFDKFKEDREDFSDILKDDRFSYLEKIGEATLADNADMVMLTCKSESDLTERSSKKAQYEIAKQVMKQERMDSAIAIFYDKKGNFRFSLVRQNYGDKDQKFSTWKRYTYFVSIDQTNKTFKQRIDIADFTSLDKIQEAFSVDKLTKQFYEELFNWYLWALSEDNGFAVKYPNDTAVEEDNRKIEEHLIRLITRLIFVWFIRRKKLIPDAIFDLKELKNIMTDFNPESKSEGNYYNAILQNLFFACLNNPIEDRKFSTDESFQGKAKDFGVKNLFRDNKKKSWFQIPKDEVVDIFKQVPFLNGGLFECLDKITDNDKILYYDGFSRDEKTKDGNLKRAFVPNALFFDKTKGLITILEKYNFTVEENAVDDVEVALDPELLGKVFENLLAAYNPETKETARKQTGSFYTPREIVDFMVDQSLIQYLVTHNKEISKEDLEEFVLKKTLPKSFTKSKIKEIEEQIKTIKILDPACGSGAYPMGILTRLYELLTLLGGSTDNHYENKLTLIENCIYGVDIQSIAVQISKLRFFIALIVEQTPNDNTTDNYGIKSLPNLETKFVAANTLIGLKQNSKDQLDLNDKDLLAMKEELWDIRNHQNFRARSFKEKKELRKKDKELCAKIKNYIHKTAGGPNEDKIKANLAEIKKAEAKLQDLPVVMVDITKVYSQVTMFEEERVTTPSMFQKDSNEEARNKLKKQILALKKEIEFERSKKGNVDTEEADNLISWDPYDQNSSSPFFDPEWMFGLSDENFGFDIVIGNPPYISAPSMVKNNPAGRNAISKSGRYATLYQKWDLYVPFIEFGLQLLKENGICTMIVPYPLTNQNYAQKLRELIVKNYNLIEVVDLNGTKVFDNATVSNCIPFVVNSDPGIECSISHINDKKQITSSFTQSYTDLVIDEKSYVWNLTAEKLQLDRHKDLNVLGDFCYISKGMVLNSDEKQTAGKFSKNDLVSDIYSKIHSREYIEAKDIERYKVKKIRYLEYNSNRCPSLLSRPTFRELYDQPKLMFNRLGSLQVYLDNNTRLLHSDSMFSAVLWKDLNGVDNKSISASITRYSRYNRCKMEELSKKIDLRYLLGILNSKYGSVLLSNMRGGDYHIYPEHLRNIPIPLPSANKQNTLITLVDSLLELIQENPEAKTDDIENNIDRLVYELYDLSKDEISLIEDN